MSGYVEVAVNSGVPHREAFSYAVPDGMTLQVGDGVFVPFGRRKLQGIVIATPEVPSFPDPKPVEARIGDRPVISAAHVGLALWISRFYLAPLFASVSLMLPPGFEQKPLTFYEAVITEEEAAQSRMPPRQKLVFDYILQNGRVEARQIERDVKERGVTTALSQLTVRGFIDRTFDLAPPSVQAKLVRYVDLIAPPFYVEAAIDSLQAARKGKLVTTLLVLSEAGGSMTATELRSRVNVNIPLLRPLVEEGLIQIREQPVERDPLAGRRYEERAAAPLTPEQQQAFETVAEALDSRSDHTFLLHGVTGSGKTEVYLHALEHTVAQGRRGIVLVPEIALTPQTVRRFAERFPGEVAVLHSGLTQGELFDQWHGIRDGRYAVVIGSRSAVFAPQPDLGLIVIDEEHEWTYKQVDPAPRYHSREAALQLAANTGAVVLLGSATPDVESYQRALWGQYRLIELRQRVRPVISSDGVYQGVTTSEALPPVEVVDMREELKGGNRTIFSRPLQLALYEALQRGEQAILFLNRRGTAGFMQCRDCGFVPQCSACAIAMGYHKHLDRNGAEVERLLCHQCNRSRGIYPRCPMCGSSRLRPMGLGVERVEESVRETFPEARTLRWDRDVTQGKDAHEQILGSFLRGEADVLIGTQMVAKGLDLPAVTVVGVISADIGLHIPDFRSAERTFQLLTQVAGRAGRTTDYDGAARGKVVIQTYTPDNYAIVAASEHDYASFFATEIALRQEQAYPPFIRLVRLVYSHTNAEYGERQAQRLAHELREAASKLGLPSVEVLGPSPPHIPKWHGRFRWQVTVRTPEPADLLRDIKLVDGWVMDIDPASIA